MKRDEQNELRAVSPELALVDEELAAWCRLRLQEDAAAEEARRSEPSKIAPRVIFLHFVSRPERKVAIPSVPPLRLLKRESVVAMAAVLLLAISGAAARPGKAPLEVQPTSFVVNWPRVPNALSYDVTVTRGSRTTARLVGLRKTRALLPRTSPGDRVQVTAVLKTGRRRIVVQGAVSP